MCCVHGYVISEGDKQPIEGELIYRGYSVKDLVNGVLKDTRMIAGSLEITEIAFIISLCTDLSSGLSSKP